MSQPAGDRVQSLFDQAVVLTPEQRRAYLDAACAGDASLRAEVESLLACDAKFTTGAGGEGLLNSLLVRAPEPAPAVVDEPLPAARPPALPARVGHYRILHRIAEGGMGSVYEAEQDSPRRAVALKIIRPGLASPSVVKRFIHEAQILGRLHHPGIAQVYEAGLADDGQPFFAMEFIRGLPLDEYARRHALDIRARVSLLARVCDAVQHAHDQGVIHRDLKPANLLVDETGQPKVLDFGVARVTVTGLLTEAGLTQTGQLLGAPNYMSPEQVTAHPAAIDQRADVYALGVILFELAAHRLPYRLENRPLAEAARVIQEQDPPWLGLLDPELRGDLEMIAAKALEKEPVRRYPSAADLAADLRHWLAHEPIQARPPSALYYLRKFTRRHKALVGSLAGIVAALAVGLIGTILFALRETQQRSRADAQTQEAQANARLAEEQRQAALHEAYYARLAAATGALQHHDVADAGRQLDLAPEALRGWEWRHLHSRLDDSSGVIPAPGSAIFLSHGADGLRLITLATQRLLVQDEQGHTQRALSFPHENELVWAVAQTPEGLLVLDRVNATTARLRDATGTVRLTVQVPTDTIISNVCLSSNLKRLVIVWGIPFAFSASVYDFSGKEQYRLSNFHRADVWSVVFSPDGTRLLTASDDHTARLWEVATGRPIGAPLRHPGEPGLLSAAFCRDGARIVTSARNGTVCQWDAGTGAAVEPPYDHHAGQVWAAVYSPDGQWIASAGADRTIRLWRATGRQDTLILDGHTGKVTQLAFTADGHRLGSVSEDGTARIWETDSQASLPVLRGHSGGVYPVAYSPDGQWIASGSWDGTVHLWDALTGERGAVLPHPRFVQALAFGPDGSWLVSAAYGDADLRIWDVATARLRRKIPAPGNEGKHLAVSPDGARIAATDWNHQERPNRASVMEIASGQELFSERDEAFFAYSPNGQWLAGRGADGKTILLRDARTHALAAAFRGHTGQIYWMAFSPDSRLLASVGLDRIVRVWDVSTRECQELHGHTDDVFAAAFHPDGTRLATAGRDRAIWLWDLEKGEEVARLAGHTNFVWSLAFRPDGKTLISGSGDTTVRLWDTAPLRVRHQARRAIEILRPEAERLVDRLFREKHEASLVAQALKEDRELTELFRRAAFHALLRREQADR
jgi:WD40 repeat protein/predicted Ser/Thr protein kinase